MCMYYYKYKPIISNVYDPYDGLKVTAVVHVYADEAKTDFLIQLPFEGFSFEEIPIKTPEGIQQYIEQKIEEQLQMWQSKLDSLKLAKDLGLYKPEEPYIEW